MRVKSDGCGEGGKRKGGVYAVCEPCHHTALHQRQHQARNTATCVRLGVMAIATWDACLEINTNISSHQIKLVELLLK
jgi:hypothetical protein